MTAGLPGTACRRRLYLMRHAEVSYFDAEGRPLDPRHVPLTDTGRRQALAAARFLAEVPFDLAVCSGLRRTVETAQLVLGDRDIPLGEDARLKEVKAGRLADVPMADRERIIAYAYDRAEQPDAAFIAGERWADFERRVLAMWTDLLHGPPWLNALVVAHDAVNRVLLAHVAGVGLAGLKAFEQDPACVNMIELDVSGGRCDRSFLRTVNFSPDDPLRLGRHLTVMEGIHRAYR